METNTEKELIQLIRNADRGFMLSASAAIMAFFPEEESFAAKLAQKYSFDEMETEIQRCRQAKAALPSEGMEEHAEHYDATIAFIERLIERKKANYEK